MKKNLSVDFIERIRSLTKEDERLSRESVFMAVAAFLSQCATCRRTKQAAVIVSDEGRIISIGFNGAPSGYTECIERPMCRTTESVKDDKTCYDSIHAEANAIAYAAKYGINLNGSTIYVTETPCLSCAKLIVASGIKRYVYLDKYRDSKGEEYLREFGVEVISYDELISSRDAT